MHFKHVSAEKTKLFVAGHIGARKRGNGMKRLATVAALVIGFGWPAKADLEVAAVLEREAPKSVCQIIDESAATHDLSVEFLTRLIWKESRFKPDALSPKGAQGIAQFMPGTAALRGLTDPFDPHQAIPAAAHYLSDLSARFGNHGLAAAAYNAGERRVANWLADGGGLPWETRDFVAFITGLPVEDWKAAIDAAAQGGAASEVSVAGGQDGAEAEAEAEAEAGTPLATCSGIAAILAKPGAGSALLAARVRRAGEAEWAPWGAQVAGNFSEARAMASWSTLQRRHPALLADRAPMVVRSVMRGRGTAPFTHIRIGAETRKAAEDLCAGLRREGAACIVLKN